MNASHIKWIAIITMFIDHIGLFFFPNIYWFRVIGRLAFPLFAWLIANGAKHTHDSIEYLKRLYIFALISQIPFFLASRLFDPHFSNLNVLCTLFFGLSAIFVIQKTQDWRVRLVTILVFIILAQFLQTDFGGFGVAVIVCFYLFFDNFRQLVIAQTLLYFANFFLFAPNMLGHIEPIGLLSLAFIKFYNNQPGLSAKYLFYIIYPLQFVLFYFLLKWLLLVI
jgi:hypothetical protein